MKVVIDGVIYKPETELQIEARKLMADVYDSLWGEAFYDSYSDATQKFAEPLSRKMTRLNEILEFRK